MLTLPPKVTPRAFARLAEIGCRGQSKAPGASASEGRRLFGASNTLIDLDEPGRRRPLDARRATAKMVGWYPTALSLPFLADRRADRLVREVILIGRPGFRDRHIPNAQQLSCGCGTSFFLDLTRPARAPALRHRGGKKTPIRTQAPLPAARASATTGARGTVDEIVTFKAHRTDHTRPGSRP